MFSIKPKNDIFYRLLGELAQCLEEAARHFRAIMQEQQHSEQLMRQLDQVEEKSDQIAKELKKEINRTFITPIDRDELFRLTQGLEHVVDYLHGTCVKLGLYKVEQTTRTGQELAGVAFEASLALAKAIKLLPELTSRPEAIQKLCQTINELESQGDNIYRTGLAQLFALDCSPLEIIKWKDLYEYMEEMLDFCDDMADLLEGVVLKYA
ncbi:MULTISPECIES: DUF47 domain-containing protein [Carboxydocella]|uniref:Phosphate transport regulator (Distant homolog of PhoU) n=2 Tax=Carboxydocella TaxID=178898 RepID=A0A1T4QV39_9FIRM|nr:MULTISPECIES: DUF47 family protein [Carboxydocella]AVX21658.1 hypothetical protein CFE_2515 [Carboxydocella thermautotrophica]AVX32069.1 hypothetical protein CTH_2530 [Carboxydocella thermautotrophica]SKA07466.1 hypothetical protein SAMN02745885_01809 [Carboxydocella sporoproducens DSM 16521]GAW27693.1 phosphate transport regulator [Carboxydocella sp. ULO1]GAW31889.1 phosphate transport regulator [Carboxydocella sp. JDF658]